MLNYLSSGRYLRGLQLDTHLVDPYLRWFGQEGSNLAQLLLQVPAGLTGLQVNWCLLQRDRDASPGRTFVQQQQAYKTHLLFDLLSYVIHW